MRITHKTNTELVIEQAKLGFRTAAMIIMIIGAMATFAVAVSGVGMVSAIVPILMVIGGSVGLRLGGKPDWVRIDKAIGLLEVGAYSGVFSKAEVQHYAISEVERLELDETVVTTGSAGMARRGLALAIRLRDGRSQTITPYCNRKRQVRAIREQAGLFFKQPG